MQKLIRGLQYFMDTVYSEEEVLFRKLAGSQSPEVLFITCSDSRVVPGMMTQSKPGDLFVIRNAGNIIPPYAGESSGGEIPTVEYAVSALGVADIIVCGHSDCGAMKAMMNPQSLEQFSTIKRWLVYAEAAYKIAMERDEYATKEDKLLTLIEMNVLLQLQHLRTHPSVASKLAQGKLHLHGWVFDIAHGSVRVFDAKEGRFVSLEGLLGGGGMQGDASG